MSQLARLLGSFAPGHEIDHGGRTYAFRLIDLEAKTSLEAAYFKRQREAVYAMRDELPADEYDRALQRASDAYARGDYALDGDGPRSFFFGRGFPLLVAAMTGRTPDEAEALTRERETDVAHVVLCIWFASFPDQKKKLLEAERRGLVPRKPLEQMLALLTPASATTPRSSHATASTPASSPGSPTDSSPRSTATPQTSAAS